MSQAVDASFRGLFAPNREYRYLADAQQRPFVADAVAWQPVNAWWLAEMSMLEYVREPAFKSAVLERSGLLRSRFFDVQATNTQCLVADNDAVVLVVFRGTELGSLRDLLTDAAVIWRREPGGGRIHQGFRDALDSLWPQLHAYLEEIAPGRPIWLAGHSLGGALATLAAHRLAGRTGRTGRTGKTGKIGRAGGLITFGCPRVGDEAFAARFGERVAGPAWRVVNNNDLVARIPPWPYVAVGQLCYLDRHGQLHLDAAESLQRDDRWRGHLQHARGVVERWADGDFDVVFNDDLYDHAPIHYARCLRRLTFTDGG